VYTRGKLRTVREVVAGWLADPMREWREHMMRQRLAQEYARRGQTYPG